MQGIDIDWERYDRQLHDLGVEGQLKLKNSKVLIVGLGGLGTPVAVYLAAAGIGTLLIVDKDVVEKTNFNRQFLFSPSDLGKPKAVVAKKKLEEFNPDINVEAYVLDVFSDEFVSLVEKADLIVDGLDGWRGRLRVNELAVKMKKPLIHAAVEAWYGQFMTVVPGKGPCLHCIFSGVQERRCIRIIGPVAGALGMMEAIETIKLLVGKGEPVIGRLLVFDLKRGRIDEIKIKRNPKCPVCSIYSE